MHEAGTTLVETERHGGPAVWYERTTSHGYGTNTDAHLFRDPTLAFLNAADNSAESAQAVLTDPTLLTYFLTEQPPYFHDRGPATANLLREATINHARDPVPPGTDTTQSTAWRAANISSHALHTAAQGTPLPETRLTLAGITATYLPDIHRVLSGNDSGLGVYDHTHLPWPHGVQASDGWPTFGIQLGQQDIHKVLQAVGGDEASGRLIAQTATAYTTILMDRAASAQKQWDAGPSQAQGAPFIGTVTDSAQLYGFLVDGLCRGDINDATQRAAERAKVANLFLLPTYAIPLDRLGPAAPVAGLILDEIKNGATRAYVGDGVALATDRSNDAWITTDQTLRLQAWEAARVHGMLPAVDIGPGKWPTDAAGHPLPVSSMTEQQRIQVLQNVGHAEGFTSATRIAVNGARDNYLNRYGTPQ
jgi:hypothetical protein